MKRSEKMYLELMPDVKIALDFIQKLQKEGVKVPPEVLNAMLRVTAKLAVVS